MFEEFLRRVRQDDTRRTLTAEERQAISDEFHRGLGVALNKAMAAGMPVRIASRYLVRFIKPLLLGMLSGKGDMTGQYTIIRGDGKIIVDGGYRGPLH